MKPLMLATDGSPTAEKATATAIDLARQLNADLYIVSVWDIPYAPYSAMGFAPVAMNGELAKLDQDQAAKVLYEAASRAEENGVEARTSILRGFPVEAICEAAERVDPQFLVVGSHGWGVVKRALFGSVSTGVLHHAPCPVLVVCAEPAEKESAKNGTRESVHA